MAEHRTGDEAGYRWIMDDANWNAFRRVAEIDRISQFHPALYLFRVIHGLEQSDRATERQVARYFGFSDYAAISYGWVLAFVEQVKEAYATIPGDEEPDGWNEDGDARFRL